MQLVDRHMVTDSITIDVGYDRENVDKGDYIGAVCTDHYGRMMPKPAHGSTKQQAATNLGSKILPAFSVLPVASHIPGRIASVEVLPNVVGDVRDDQLRLGDVVGFEILEVLIVQFTFQFGFSP